MAEQGKMPDGETGLEGYRDQASVLGPPCDLKQFVERFRNFGPNCAQLLDACKMDWGPADCWSEWDQSVREELTALQLQAESLSKVWGRK